MRQGNKQFEKGLSYLKFLKKQSAVEKYGSATMMESFYMCHHCRNFLHKKYMAKCNYKSSLMGFPILNKSMIFESIDLYRPFKIYLTFRRKFQTAKKKN